ncbi:MAG: hypothetical protein OXH51_13330 [Gemmatimonadetes bacterium]|nr:hypothetical protein [Gemmatimonadota bacterium]MCY3676501.1 hypothetical protein [Gemmatimonadota bacterium]MYA43304.1 hypothetical protein [Gemmatimonadota bacterium]MYE91789.1 hypothetical protein [Gemmatimonadota bacterium]MYJ10167.1 hypothetical protein [Gemmatimonadota bacterium]
MRTERIVNTARGASVILVAGAVLVGVASLGASGARGSGGTPASLDVAALDVPQDTVSFADDILPIFRQRCAECHGAEDENGEVRTEVSLNLLNYERVMMGSEFGTVIEAGDPANSFLLDMIVDGTMPETGDPVPEDEIALIRAWIEAGAPNN